MGIYGETIDIGSPLFRRLTDDHAILSQAIVMRLSTRRGTYWDDPEYGLPISDYVNEGLTEEGLARIPTEVQAELEKDERIATVIVSASISLTSAGVRLLISIEVTPNDIGPFSLTLSVSELGIELLTRGSA